MNGVFRPFHNIDNMDMLNLVTTPDRNKGSSSLENKLRRLLNNERLKRTRRRKRRKTRRRGRGSRRKRCSRKRKRRRKKKSCKECCYLF